MGGSPQEIENPGAFSSLIWSSAVWKQAKSIRFQRQGGQSTPKSLYGGFMGEGSADNPVTVFIWEAYEVLRAKSASGYTHTETDGESLAVWNFAASSKTLQHCFALYASPASTSCIPSLL